MHVSFPTTFFVKSQMWKISRHQRNCPLLTGGVGVASIPYCCVTCYTSVPGSCHNQSISTDFCVENRRVWNNFPLLHAQNLKPGHVNKTQVQPLTVLTKTMSKQTVYYISALSLPRPPWECFLEVFCWIKPTKKHFLGGPGMHFSKKQTSKAPWRFLREANVPRQKKRLLLLTGPRPKARENKGRRRGFRLNECCCSTCKPFANETERPNMLCLFLALGSCSFNTY